jgi:hypothetical protein
VRCSFLLKDDITMGGHDAATNRIRMKIARCHPVYLSVIVAFLFGEDRGLSE